MAVHRAAKLANMASVQHTSKKRGRQFDPLLDDVEEFPTAEQIAAMPDPAPLLPAIATLVVEVIAGARSVDHMAALVSDQVYEKLRAKVTQKNRQDAMNGRPALMPKFAVTKVKQDSPRLGVIESVVLVSTQARTRAVAIRLEPIHQKWRATSVSVL
jgi:hypothetical protein